MFTSSYRNQNKQILWFLDLNIKYFLLWKRIFEKRKQHIIFKIPLNFLENFPPSTNSQSHFGEGNTDFLLPLSIWMYIWLTKGIMNETICTKWSLKCIRNICRKTEFNLNVYFGVHKQYVCIWCKETLDFPPKLLPHAGCKEALRLRSPKGIRDMRIEDI